jgi:hypothetical protein
MYRFNLYLAFFCLITHSMKGDEFCFYNPQHSHFYIGVDAGFCTGLGHADRSIDSGVGNFILGHSARPHSGHHGGFNLGYRWSCLLRTDFSYTALRPNSYQWKGDPLTGPVSDFNAKLNSDLWLANIYFHLNGFCCAFKWIDPYITGGIGYVYNLLNDIKQFSGGADSSLVANIASRGFSNIGGRLGIGFLKYFGNWIFDFGFHGNYLGRITSGNFQSNGLQQTIGPFNFKNNWIGTLFFGLKYGF